MEYEFSRKNTQDYYQIQSGANSTLEQENKN